MIAPPRPEDEHHAPGTSCPALDLRRVSKTFGKRAVLNNVSMHFSRGEVHGLMGQNGSGKSTLIKLLSGYHVADPGSSMYFDAQPFDPRSDKVPIAFVHQDLALIADGTVLDNFCVRRFDTTRLGRIDWNESQRRVETALARFDLHIRSDALVSALSPTERAFLALARAVDELPTTGCRVLVLDEPTPYLPQDGVDRLAELVRRAAASQVAVIFVSHDVEETKRLCDTVTVLRDGEVVASQRSESVSESELVRQIVGGVVDRKKYQRPHSSRASSVAALSLVDVEGTESAVDRLDSHAGQILGLTGLIGSGYDELLYIAAGATAARSGHVVVGEQPMPVEGLEPPTMIRHGVVLVPGDRLGMGAVSGATASENLTMVHLARFVSRFCKLSKRSERAWAESTMARLGVRPSIADQAFELFSGGNQQKLVLAKWLELEPTVLLVHEPTQGVDVGARQQIYARLREAAEAGVAVVVASADFDDFPDYCDTVAVFRRGTVFGTLDGSDITQHNISQLCFGMVDSDCA
jgi:ribose transport system ATP-binding protein